MTLMRGISLMLMALLALSSCVTHSETIGPEAPSAAPVMITLTPALPQTATTHKYTATPILGLKLPVFHLDQANEGIVQKLSAGNNEAVIIDIAWSYSDKMIAALLTSGDSIVWKRSTGQLLGTNKNELSTLAFGVFIK